MAVAAILPFHSHAAGSYTDTGHDSSQDSDQPQFPASMASGTLPVLYINTVSGEEVLAKEYMAATYWLDATPMADIFDSFGSPNQPLDLQIKGRGNQTWSLAKKPYKLKLGAKTPLLGMPKNKHFTLMAAYDGDTYSWFFHDQLGFATSRALGLAWTPTQHPVELIINGQYHGLYLLCEHVRVDKNRVNIPEQPDLSEDPAEIEGGWLVERDNQQEANSIVCYEKPQHNSGMYFITPDSPEELSQQQADYLTDVFTRFSSALQTTDKTDNSWEEIFDVETAARYYIIQEITMNYEAFSGSCKIHKGAGADAKWQFGPVWDFGNAYLSWVTHDKWKEVEQRTLLDDDNPYAKTFIRYMVEFPHFMETVKRVWTEFYVDYDGSIERELRDWGHLIEDALEPNFTRWPERRYRPEMQEEKVELMISRLANRMRYLDSIWHTDQDPKVANTFAFGLSQRDDWDAAYAYIQVPSVNGCPLFQPLGDWPGQRLTELSPFWVEQMGLHIWAGTDQYSFYSHHFFTDIDIPSDAYVIFHDGSKEVDEDLMARAQPFVSGHIYLMMPGADITSIKAGDSSQSLMVSAVKGALRIVSEKETDIQIVSPVGIPVSVRLQAGENTIPLQQGLYIVANRKYAVR